MQFGVVLYTILRTKKNTRLQITSRRCNLDQGTLKVGYCPKMENSLFTLFTQERSKHILVSGEILNVKAIEIYPKN